MSEPGTARRRWVNEQTVLGEMERLADLSMETVADYAVHSAEAAKAEADYKALKARTTLRFKAESTSSRPSVAEAELHADADPAVAEAYLNRLVTAALTDTDREALRSIRVNQDALRTAAASARDGVIGPGMSGGR